MTVHKALLRVWWDDGGWYAIREESTPDGWDVLEDSQKVWFPVDVDNYDEGQRESLLEALAEAFPHDDIEISNYAGWDIVKDDVAKLVKDLLGGYPCLRFSLSGRTRI